MTASKVAIVTGGGSGVGRAAALALLRDGWNVVLAGRRAEPLQAVIEESQAGARALGVPTDVSNPDSVKALFDAAVKAGSMNGTSAVMIFDDHPRLEIDPYREERLAISAVKSA